MKIKSFAVIVATCTILCHWDAFGCSEGVFMKEIQLTQGYVTIVDDDDYEHINQWKWFAARFKNTVYAHRNERVGGKQRTVRMHREILGIADSSVFCDHKDGNGLNNQRCNLRECTKRENNLNCKRKTSDTSNYKGVSLYAPNNKWGARIMHNGNAVHLGYHETENAAAKAYNEAAMKHHGEFAYLNTINE